MSPPPLQQQKEPPPRGNIIGGVRPIIIAVGGEIVVFDTHTDNKIKENIVKT